MLYNTEFSLKIINSLLKNNIKLQNEKEEKKENEIIFFGNLTGYGYNKLSQILMEFFRKFELKIFPNKSKQIKSIICSLKQFNTNFNEKKFYFFENPVSIVELPNINCRNGLIIMLKNNLKKF